MNGVAETLDRASFAAIAQATHGLSPATMAQAFSDWAMHLAVSPGKQMQLAGKADHKVFRLADYLAYRSDPVKLGLGHLTIWEKVALVADVTRLQQASDFFSFMMPVEMKSFSLARAEEAKR